MYTRFVLLRMHLRLGFFCLQIYILFPEYFAWDVVTAVCKCPSPNHSVNNFSQKHWKTEGGGSPRIGHSRIGHPGIGQVSTYSTKLAKSDQRASFEDYSAWSRSPQPWPRPWSFLRPHNAGCNSSRDPGWRAGSSGFDGCRRNDFEHPFHPEHRNGIWGVNPWHAGLVFYFVFIIDWLT